MTSPYIICIISTFIFLQFATGINAQLQVFTTLQSAKDAAKNSKKHLIILRTEFSTIRWSRDASNPTSEWHIDELLKSEKLQHELMEDFVLYTYDFKESAIDDQNIMQVNYLHDYTPNMIILDHKEQHIAYLKLSLFDLNSDLNAMIRSSIAEFKPQVDKAAELESKFERNQITSAELNQLIQHRANLSLSSKKHLNYLAVHNMAIPMEQEELRSPVLAERFTIEDPFFSFYVQSNEIQTGNKIQFLAQIKEASVYAADVRAYHQLIPMIDSLNEKLFTEEIEGTEFEIYFPKSSFLDNSRQLMESINVYAKAGELEFLDKASETYVAQVFRNYNVRKKDQVAAHISMMELLKPSIIEPLIAADTTQTFSWEKYIEEESRKAATGLDEDISSNLNEMAWIYYQYVDSESDLKKAIDWCQKSLEFHSRKENNDTIAHLHYKLGNKELAVQYQTIAVSLAEAEGLHEQYLKHYKDQLAKFKGE